MGRRKLPPKKLRLISQIERAHLLAEEAEPLVADLYLIHAHICEEKRSRSRAGSQIFKRHRRDPTS